MKTLREHRRDKLLSIRELARAAGVSTQTIHGIEHRGTEPRFSTMRKLAAALGVPAREIAEFAKWLDGEGRDDA